MVAMEDKGEIVSFMGHVKENEILKVTESIVFVMDGVRSSPTKKRRLSKARLKMSPPPAHQLCFGRILSASKPLKPQLRVRMLWQVRPLVFGAYMDAVKLRSVRPPFKLTWRLRPGRALAICLHELITSA